MKALWIVGKVLLAFVLVFGGIGASVWYINWSAERHARAFCDDAPVGSSVSPILDRAAREKILFGNQGGVYTFYFSGSVFDKAVCEIETDSNRNVTKKYSLMEYD